MGIVVVGLEAGRGCARVKSGFEGVHEFAAIDEHREVGAGARLCVELALTLAGYGRENDDAGATLDHFQAIFRGTVSGRGNDDIIKTFAIEDGLAESGECEPPRAFDLADQCMAQSRIGCDDPD